MRHLSLTLDMVSSATIIVPMSITNNNCCLHTTFRKKRGWQFSSRHAILTPFTLLVYSVETPVFSRWQNVARNEKSTQSIYTTNMMIPENTHRYAFRHSNIINLILELVHIPFAFDATNLVVMSWNVSNRTKRSSVPNCF